ncbi:MAG: hemerythrin domain-containing protein [Thermoplasmatota archaeon]
MPQTTVTEPRTQRWPASWRRLAARPSRPVTGARMEGPWLAVRPYALNLLHYGHKRLRRLATDLEMSHRARERRSLLFALGAEFALHSRVEHEIFYPAYHAACRNARERELYHEATEEQRALESLLQDLYGAEVESTRFSGRARAFRVILADHIREEERHLFHAARRALGRTQLRLLGRRMQDRRRTLMVQPTAAPLTLPRRLPAPEGQRK